jgi:BolA family transcriptional regulator, general stress-responsive regulator
VSVADEIRSRLRALEPQALELTDNSALHAGHVGAAPGGNTHWRLVIVSPAFSGRNTVARHRMVYDALRDLMNSPIHALEIEARAPGEPGT